MRGEFAILYSAQRGMLVNEMKSFESMGALLRNAVDYAGLFAPASLDLAASLANYRAYRAGGDAWALGSLILPVSALSEFERSAGVEEGIPVSVVLGVQPERDLQEIAERSRSYKLFECKLPDAARLRGIMKELPEGARMFFEVDAGSASPDVFAAIHGAGASAKIRTGGVVRSAIPSAQDVARFLCCCARAALPFKATAGLHHPVRGRYRLTYADDAPYGTMHGFVNVLFAAGLVYHGASEREACEVLEETRGGAFSFGPDGVSWRDCRLSVEQISTVRTKFFAGFGSCSFTEPVEESRALGWIV